MAKCDRCDNCGGRGDTDPFAHLTDEQRAKLEAAIKLVLEKFNAHREIQRPQDDFA